MARRASGISGVVSGISVNVKHTFLKDGKREEDTGKRKLRDSKSIGKLHMNFQKCIRTFLKLIIIIYK